MYRPQYTEVIILNGNISLFHFIKLCINSQHIQYDFLILSYLKNNSFTPPRDDMQKSKLEFSVNKNVRFLLKYDGKLEILLVKNQLGVTK